MKAYDLLAALNVISTTKDIPLILMSSKISFEVENIESTYKFTSKINKTFQKKSIAVNLIHHHKSQRRWVSKKRSSEDGNVEPDTLD